MKLPVIFAAAVLAASPAIAQQTGAIGTDRWTEVEADMVIPPFGKQADLIKNMQVHGPQGGIIGDIEDVVGFGEAQALAVSVDFTGQAGGWQLVPRSIPPMEESPVRFAKIRRAEGIAPAGAAKGKGRLAPAFLVSRGRREVTSRAPTSRASPCRRRSS